MTRVSTSAKTLAVFREASVLSWAAAFIADAGKNVDIAVYGYQQSDHHTFALDEQPEAVAAWIRGQGYSHVVLFSNQAGVSGDSRIAEILRASGMAVAAQSTSAAHIGSNKILQKQLLAEQGIPTPAFGVASDVVAAVRIAQKIGYPVVIKAPDLSDGRRMGVANFDEGVESYFYEQSPQDAVLIEKFVAGEEVSTIVYSNFGAPIVFPVVYKSTTDYLLQGTSVRGRTYVMPHPRAKKGERRIQDLALKVSELMGNEFLVGLDIVLDEQGNPYILECNARLVETLRMSMVASEINVPNLMLREEKMRMSSPYVQVRNMVVDMKAPEVILQNPNAARQGIPEIASIASARLTLRGQDLEHLYRVVTQIQMQSMLPAASASSRGRRLASALRLL